MSSTNVIQLDQIGAPVWAYLNRGGRNACKGAPSAIGRADRSESGRITPSLGRYDALGNPYLVTSYNAASGGSIVNQVENLYNGLDQLIQQYQAHAGAVVVGTTPSVQYAYNELAGGANNSRLLSVTYPNGRVLNFNYNTSLDSTISRLSSISDSSATLESYKYLGLGTVVERDHPQTNVNLTYISQTGGTGDAGDK